MGMLDIIIADVRKSRILCEITPRVDVIFHLAAQVAMTLSLQDPRSDFDTNVIGTINVLEALRKTNPGATLLYSSTNKVYGNLSRYTLVETDTRYVIAEYPQGVDESLPLDFQSPYGCSKGAADQYVLDYARSFDLKTIVFRQSCIYGAYQYGSEAQGWVSHFLSTVHKHETLRVFGSGKQVRDLLFVEDLVLAMLRAVDQISVTRGQVFNIGGGPANSLSIWAEFKNVMSHIVGTTPTVCYLPERLSDQRYFVSNIQKAHEVFGWRPHTTVEMGLASMWDWMQSERL